MTTEQKTTEDNRGYDEEISRIAKSATRIGAAWAKYGIEIGRAALATSAVTLETTAELLGSVATSLDRAVPKDDGAGEARVETKQTAA